jgi:hypothetical protein
LQFRLVPGKNVRSCLQNNIKGKKIWALSSNPNTIRERKIERKKERKTDRKKKTRDKKSSKIQFDRRSGYLLNINFLSFSYLRDLILEAKKQ